MYYLFLYHDNINIPDNLSALNKIIKDNNYQVISFSLTKSRNNDMMGVDIVVLVTTQPVYYEKEIIAEKVPLDKSLFSHILQEN
jgi:tRNA A-37 threonylcarbamoyl transferase component Bud32